MQNLLAHTLRENSTFGINYFVGGLPALVPTILYKNWVEFAISRKILYLSRVYYAHKGISLE
ncbi:hypothetical protein EAS68_07430 [Legionella jordanis]|nr:hypothetical protein EAS68_07430 [Legionella jordanis]